MSYTPYLYRCEFAFSCRWVVVLIILLLSSSGAQAQTVNDVSLRGLRTVHQNSFINPSWLPDTNLLGEHRASTGFHFGADLRSNYINIRNVLNSLNHNNDIRILELLPPPPSTFAHTGITATLGTGMTTLRPLSRSVSLSLGYQVKGQIAINLNGTGLFKGRSSTIGRIKQKLLHALTWAEISLGIAGRYKAFDYGIRLKYLGGIAHANVDADLGIYISEDSVNLDYNNISVYYGHIGDNPYTMGPNGHGLAVDIGLNFRISKKTSLDFSLLDLGFIGVNQYYPANAVQPTNRTITYLRDPYIRLDDSLLSRYVDNNSTFTEITTIPFEDSLASTSIIPLYYQFGLGVKHNFNGNWQIGAIYHHLSAPASFKYMASVYGSYRFLRNWEVTLNTGLREGSVSAVGMGLSYTSPRFQAFITTENIFAFPFTYDSKNFHILFGFNFRIGKQSLKLNGPVDKILCSDPIVDEELAEEAIMLKRRGILDSYEKQRKGLKYNKKYPDGILKNGLRNKNPRKYDNASYSEIISKEGNEGGSFNKVEYIGEKLSERQLPAYNPIEVEPNKQDKKINKDGKTGDYYNEKYEVPLPKRQKPEPKRSSTQKNQSKFLNYGQSGGVNNRNKQNLNFGSKGATSKKRSQNFGSQKGRKLNKRKSSKNNLGYGTKGGRRKNKN